MLDLLKLAEETVGRVYYVQFGGVELQPGEYDPGTCSP